MPNNLYIFSLIKFNTNNLSVVSCLQLHHHHCFGHFDLEILTRILTTRHKWEYLLWEYNPYLTKKKSGSNLYLFSFYGC